MGADKDVQCVERFGNSVSQGSQRVCMYIIQDLKCMCEVMASEEVRKGCDKVTCMRCADEWWLEIQPSKCERLHVSLPKNSARRQCPTNRGEPDPRKVRVQYHPVIL